MGASIAALFGGCGTPLITPEQTEQLHPEEAQVIAASAEQEDPGIMDRKAIPTLPIRRRDTQQAALAIAMS